MISDQDFLDHLRRAERTIDQYGARGKRDALEYLDRSLRGRCQDRTQRDALHHVCSGLADGSARALDETIEALQAHLRRIDSPRQHEKMIRFAENYGADSKTLDRLRQQAIQDILNVSFPPGMTLDSALGMPLTQQTTMNKTSTELQAELDATLKAEAAASAAKEADDKLVYHIDLATATKNLLQAIRAKQTGPVLLLAAYRRVLAPLAREFGCKVILVGDAAFVVQR